MTAAIRVGDAALQADVSGALFQPESATLIVADLHLEKGSHFARVGRPNDVHYTSEGSALLAAEVVRSVTAHLPSR